MKYSREILIAKEDTIRATPQAGEILNPLRKHSDTADSVSLTISCRHYMR